MKKEKIEASIGAPAGSTTTEIPTANQTIQSIAPKRECECLGVTSESIVVKKQKLESTIINNDVIIILSDDDDDDTDNKKSYSAVDTSGNDDDVIIVEPPKTADGTISIHEDLNDEVQAIGEKNAVHLPHMRQHCTKFQFYEDVRYRLSSYSVRSELIAEARKGKELNAKHCDLCYCFICDKPVSQCENWSSEASSLNSHCHASDKGTHCFYYKALRDSYKRGKTITPTPPLRTNGINGDRLFDHLGRLVNNYNSPLAQTKAVRGGGPFSPDDEVAKTDRDLTKCRKCGWYNLFSHLNYTRSLHAYHTGSSYPTCPLDWCHACGRVASERDFEKCQSEPYEPVEGDVLFGSREIAFKVKAHDPRKFEKFSKFWKDHEGSPEWEYDEAEMEYDFFRHRIGKRPTLSMILMSIPVTK
eukprot:CAMPEP_0176484956 /NCGR_PEP_ID=MMETSP0200_2-20121128/4783_1 /TAXON_ID=947934 /ORGANISM="Chaetoceros sp., Strain GSL56" /LENGTH=414 /DNA_ID=CAMNT_0017881569 /DNA_START=147 /DNA_END=1388 /DNA_ORIENTATION=+